MSDPTIYQLEKPWSNNENNIWIASTISLYRNLDNFLFPSKLDKAKKNQIIQLIKQELFKLKILNEPTLCKADELSLREKEYLVEHYLSTQSYQHSQGGEGFIVDATGNFLATLNIGNHLQLELIDCQGQLERGWNHLVQIETKLGKALNYAFNSRFGFLTSDPQHSGTGFILSAYLQPTALIHTNRFNQMLLKHSKEGIVVMGLQGTPGDYIGDVMAIRNQYTLGLTEENIVSTVRLFITKMLVEEQAVRTELKNSPDPDVMDLVSRAYALLTHSYQLDEIEALNAISLLKMGVDIGWVQGISVRELNHLFFACRRSHLLSHIQGEVGHEEINHKRSEYIHKVIKAAHLIENFD